MKNRQWLILGWLGMQTLSACVPFSDLTSKIHQQSQQTQNARIQGHVHFPSAFALKTSLADLQANATISLLYPADHPTFANQTVATGKTGSGGAFTLNADSGFVPATNEIFILEAGKRLGATGSELITLRTYLRWNGSGWESISTPGIQLNSRTTALVLMDSLDARFAAVDTFGQVQIDGSGNSSFAGNLNTITQAELDRVDGLINSLVGQGRDPARYLAYSNQRYTVTSPPNPQLQALIDTRNCPECNLKEADLSSRDLTNAILPNANLSLVNLANANLSLANLSHTDLRSADLSHANLTGADLSDSLWQGTNFSQATWVNGKTCQPGSTGACSYEQQVNTTETGLQNTPYVALNDKGDGVVVWASNGQDGNGYGVYGQRFNRYGNKVGGEFLVNHYTHGNQSPSDVAIHQDGRFAVVYNDDESTGDDAPMIHLFNADGQAVLRSGDSPVQTSSGYQGKAKVRFLPNGQALTVCLDKSQGNNIYYRTFDELEIPQIFGTQVSENMATACSTSGKECDQPALAVNNTGRFVVGFLQNNGSNQNVFARIYTSVGNPAGNPIQLSTNTSAKFQVSLAMNNNGDFVAVWDSRFQDGNGWGVYGRIFSANGQPKTPEFRINDYTNLDQQYPQVTTDGQNRFTVVWHSFFQVPTSTYTVYSHTYNWDGLPLTLEKQVNFTNGTWQSDPALAMNTAGHWLAAWVDNDAGGTGIAASYYGF